MMTALFGNHASSVLVNAAKSGIGIGKFSSREHHAQVVKYINEYGNLINLNHNSELSEIKLHQIQYGLQTDCNSCVIHPDDIIINQQIFLQKIPNFSTVVKLTCSNEDLASCLF